VTEECRLNRLWKKAGKGEGEELFWASRGKKKISSVPFEGERKAGKGNRMDHEMCEEAGALTQGKSSRTYLLGKRVRTDRGSINLANKGGEKKMPQKRKKKSYLRSD